MRFLLRLLLIPFLTRSAVAAGRPHILRIARGDTGPQSGCRPEDSASARARAPHLDAAEALANPGRDEEALSALREGLRHEPAFIRPEALNVAGRPGARAASLLPAIRNAKLKDPASRDATDYAGRRVDYVPGRIARQARAAGPAAISRCISCCRSPAR